MVFADQPQPRRKPSLTPMIDVVFLLLVFFMLASQFGLDQVVRLPLAAAGNGAQSYSGPPRLVTITREGLRLNGVEIALADLPDALQSLTDTLNDPVILRGQNAATSQQVLDVLGPLQAAGFTAVVLVE
ncbi:ExbD/TolR family protein [Neptunicoccus sediminis]|uniref:ExbD/TolR family protein n=1 Tax=Neptunicoccus sediminis TaxID=1892596 RepID=UPI000845CA0B|nr:biopolymer transporter ExbD [Neptunicoccus sediminis]